jgi:hypothetical protein
MLAPALVVCDCGNVYQTTCDSLVGHRNASDWVRGVSLQSETFMMMVRPISGANRLHRERPLGPGSRPPIKTDFVISSAPARLPVTQRQTSAA